MLDKGTSTNLHWYAVRTNARQEERVVQNLNAWRVETFAPKIEERRYQPSSNKPFNVIKPLFPSYIFARFDVQASLHKIRFTRGVCDIVTTGLQPAQVDDEIILLIKSRVNEKGLVRICEDFQEGDEITIRSGPFKDFRGVFVRGTNDAQRVIVLLNCVTYQPHVQIDRNLLKKVSSRPI